MSTALLVWAWGFTSLSRSRLQELGPEMGNGSKAGN